MTRKTNTRDWQATENRMLDRLEGVERPYAGPSGCPLRPVVIAYQGGRPVTALRPVGA